MTLPVKACSDEELEGYASIHPEAAAELAARIVAGQHQRDARLIELAEEVTSCEDEVTDLNERLAGLREAVDTACIELREAIDDASISDDLRARLKQAIRNLELSA
ncbi:hypothetical protein PSGK_19025 [Pseudomonas solani]|uniref:hypothetical protein n=1 Tax=Pseudomonas solani TaxID=2731552 RepID=UPI0035BE9EB3